MDVSNVLHLIIVLFPFFLWFIYYIIKKNQPSLIKKINEDKRNPVLYLRSFEDTGVGPKVDIALVEASILNNQFYTYEQILSNFFKPIGPFIAIGDPTTNEKLVGVNTDKFSDDDWQTVVMALIEEASIIVFKPNNSEGLIWEFKQIIVNDFLSKTIIYTQIGKFEDDGVRKAFYNKFRKKISEISKIQLPEYSPKEKFVYFDEELNPYLTANPRNSLIYTKRINELKATQSLN